MKPPHGWWGSESVRLLDLTRTRTHTASPFPGNLGGGSASETAPVVLGFQMRDFGDG